MATYAIGDVQGCFSALERLLDKVNFDAKHDTVWFTGDLVNRGPQSLEVLRFVKALGDRQVTVLGNHDLHLLAVAYGVAPLRPGDTLDAILAASDCMELMNWLRQRPLLHEGADYVMVHAGLAPAWSLKRAMVLAQEVERALQGPKPEVFLADLYGDQPDGWNDQLAGVDRLRCITNYFTRMRYCDAEGRLDLACQAGVGARSLVPWFAVPKRANADINIIFGHWAELNGQVDVKHVYALDTGCVWGKGLTAMRLEDEKRFYVSCR